MNSVMRRGIAFVCLFSFLANTLAFATEKRRCNLSFEDQQKLISEHLDKAAAESRSVRIFRNKIEKSIREELAACEKAGHCGPEEINRAVNDALNKHLGKVGRYFGLLGTSIVMIVLAVAGTHFLQGDGYLSKVASQIFTGVYFAIFTAVAAPIITPLAARTGKRAWAVGSSFIRKPTEWVAEYLSEQFTRTNKSLDFMEAAARDNLIHLKTSLESSFALAYEAMVDVKPEDAVELIAEKGLQMHNLATDFLEDEPEFKRAALSRFTRRLMRLGADTNHNEKAFQGRLAKAKEIFAEMAPGVPLPDGVFEKLLRDPLIAGPAVASWEDQDNRRSFFLALLSYTKQLHEQEHPLEEKFPMAFYENLYKAWLLLD
jgi:hypothetical protein